MDITYESTRGGEKGLTASQAILKGLADDGGLFMPDVIPVLDVPLKDLVDMDYRELAVEIMKLFFTDFTEEELKACVEQAYDSKFDVPQIALLREADGAYYLELYHGRTIAFKDMALSVLPYLLTTAARKNGVTDEIVILTATSGDTGKAALAAFADVPGTRIIVFYPKGGVSRIQELQMVTQKGDNTAVVALHGNFDEAQSGVKAIFGDRAFCDKLAEHGFLFSSANSINIGRLIPQVVYYVYGYLQLVRDNRINLGDEINITVPTGNFGNILAAYLAKRIGLPVKTLICASNDNKVLYDFFETGTYDRRREFILTSSPSMDILISSNLERLIYLAAGCDAAKNRELMDKLAAEGIYEISDDMRDAMKDFVGGFATEAENAEEIKRLYDVSGYVIDTHTGVGSRVYRDYVRRTGDQTPTIIASTASPFKFAQSVMGAIAGDQSEKDAFEVIDELADMAQLTIPPAIEEIRNAEIRHHRECDPQDMEAEVADILGI